MRHCVNENISVWESEALELSDALREAADLVEDSGIEVATLYLTHNEERTSVIIHGYSITI